jgi:protein-S-isoprenylcysteine O-methyltransferase Ste14
MLHTNQKDNLFVFAQFSLFAIFWLDPEFKYFNFPSVLQYPGLLMSLTGLVICGVSILQLNKNLTAFPTPKESARLYSGGLYQYIRHPIYTGVIMFFAGLSLYFGSVFKLLITLMLIILFYFKAAYEEDQLSKKFPEYEQYKSKTGKFLPVFK